ncbi:MAG: hypothetical protein CBC09_02325 [Cellvibrionales bacterium TMED49]|nr:MAG: hypothetical protein CBC09_02325 [Cellvibrionales bacterium TMED49]
MFTAHGVREPSIISIIHVMRWIKKTAFSSFIQRVSEEAPIGSLSSTNFSDKNFCNTLFRATKVRCSTG